MDILKKFYWLKQPTNIILIALLAIGCLLLQSMWKANRYLTSINSKLFNIQNDTSLDEKLEFIEANLEDINHNTRYTELNTRD